MSVQEILFYVKGEGGADLFLTAGVEPRMRRYGVVHSIPSRPVLDPKEVLTLMQEVCPRDVWVEYERTRDVDFAFSVKGIGRIRANYLQQTRGPAAVYRLIPDEIMPFNQLGVPASIARFADRQSGLVLVTGPVGSGKTTTLAAVIDIINKKSARHIVTIEDPVEFIHNNRKSIVTQREVGTSCVDFGPALRDALRQDANVILVGELRDYDTAVTTLVAAEMGKLVFASMHTPTAPRSRSTAWSTCSRSRSRTSPASPWRTPSPAWFRRSCCRRLTRPVPWSSPKSSCAPRLSDRSSATATSP